jgi:hypothetical protein
MITSLLMWGLGSSQQWLWRILSSGACRCVVLKMYPDASEGSALSITVPSLLVPMSTPLFPRSAYFSILKIEAARSSETSVNVFQTTRSVSFMISHLCTVYFESLLIFSFSLGTWGRKCLHVHPLGLEGFRSTKHLTTEYMYSFLEAKIQSDYESNNSRRPSAAFKNARRYSYDTRSHSSRLHGIMLNERR